jgi:hypothetical protein
MVNVNFTFDTFPVAPTTVTPGPSTAVPSTAPPVPSTAAPTTPAATTPEAVAEPPVTACNAQNKCTLENGATAKTSPTCVANSCRCPIGFVPKGLVCSSGKITTIEGLKLGTNYEPGFSDPTSAAFVNFAKGFELSMRKFIHASLNIVVYGVQVISLSQGSTVVNFAVVMDPVANTTAINQLKDKLVDDAFNLNRYMGSYRVDTNTKPAFKVASGCSLEASPCGEDFICVPGNGMGFKCQCKKDNDGQCIKDTLQNWKIAVIVVAVFVFLLMVIIIIAIVRMYRRRHYTGKAYVSEHGRDNTGATLS